MWSFKTALFYHWGDMKYWSRSDYAHGLGASKLKNSILALPNNNKNSEHSIYNFLSGRGKNFCDFSVRPSVRPSVRRHETFGKKNDRGFAYQWCFWKKFHAQRGHFDEFESGQVSNFDYWLDFTFLVDTLLNFTYFIIQFLILNNERA